MSKEFILSVQLQLPAIVRPWIESSNQIPTVKQTCTHIHIQKPEKQNIKHNHVCVGVLFITEACLVITPDVLRASIMLIGEILVPAIIEHTDLFLDIQFSLSHHCFFTANCGSCHATISFLLESAAFLQLQWATTSKERTCGLDLQGDR